MRILVLGLYFSNNLGDAVICDCVSAQLHEHFPSAQIDIRDFMDRSDFSAVQEIPVDELERRRRRSMLRRYASRYMHWDKQAKHENAQILKSIPYIDGVCRQNYDFVVFAGGQVFADSLALYLEAFVQRFSQKRTPMFFNACGTGPSASRQIRKRLSAALSDFWVKFVSSRDDVSLINQCYLAGTKTAVYVCDPALHCSEVYQVARNSRSNIVGLGMMYTNSIPSKAVLKFWKRLILELEQKGVNWKIFVNGSGSDVAFARYVISNLHELDRPFEQCVAPVPRKPLELVQLIAGFRSIISFRLHSHIIAASLDIPSVGIVWDDKLGFFFRKIGHEERCCTVADQPETVLKKLQIAEKEGYNRLLIEKQKQYSANLLFDTICCETQISNRKKDLL